MQQEWYTAPQGAISPFFVPKPEEAKMQVRICIFFLFVVGITDGDWWQPAHFDSLSLMPDQLGMGKSRRRRNIG
jgi:hypothetical protein